MPNADRAAVAREVLTEIANAHRELGFTAIVDVMESWRDEHYPAPPAPETVTVGDDVYSRRGDTWYVGGFNIGLTLRHRELLDRIASDARVIRELERSRDAWEADARREAGNVLYWHGERDRAIEAIQERDARIAELEVELHETRERQLPMVRLRDEAYRQRDAAHARIAELENELRRALDGTVFHEKQAYEARTERDAALRALEDWKQAALTLGESLTPNGPDGYYAMTPAEWLKWAKAATSQGEGLAEKGTVNSEDAKAQVVREPTRPASPAPIPLGAVVEVSGMEWAPFTRSEGGWFDKDSHLWFDSEWWGMFATALYHARHPVATRETVERVRKALLQAFRATRVGEDFTENCTRAALTAAGFTLEGGA